MFIEPKKKKILERNNKITTFAIHMYLSLFASGILINYLAGIRNWTIQVYFSIDSTIQLKSAQSNVTCKAYVMCKEKLVTNYD